MEKHLIRKPNAFLLKCILLLGAAEFLLERLQERMDVSYLASLGIVRRYNGLSLLVPMALFALLLLACVFLAPHYQEPRLSRLAKWIGFPVLFLLAFSCVSHLAFFTNVLGDVQSLKDQRFSIAPVSLDEMQRIQANQGLAILYVGEESGLSSQEALEGLETLAESMPVQIYYYDTSHDREYAQEAFQEMLDTYGITQVPAVVVLRGGIPDEPLTGKECILAELPQMVEESAEKGFFFTPARAKLEV